MVAGGSDVGGGSQSVGLHRSDISRGIATADRGNGAAARSLSEVKVRCVGTGCARIHFFGLTVCTFFSKRRGISSHVHRPSLHWPSCARYLPATNVHTRVSKHTHTRSWMCWPLSLSLPLCLYLPIPILSRVFSSSSSASSHTRTHALTHTDRYTHAVSTRLSSFAYRLPFLAVAT